MPGSLHVVADTTPAPMSISCVDNTTQLAITCTGATVSVAVQYRDSDDQTADRSPFVNLPAGPSTWASAHNVAGQYLRIFLTVTPWAQQFQSIMCADTAANCEADSTKWKLGNAWQPISPSGAELFTNGQGPPWQGAATIPATTTGVMDADNGIIGPQWLSSGTLTVGDVTCDSSHVGWYMVADSTAVASEGQTCVGSSNHKVALFCDGSVKKCF
jgi:hypothetical protein